MGSAPLGDYGDILVHGMSRHRARVDGRIQLERAGPYIPPLSLPGIADIVVTSELKALLERERVAGAAFAPVDKAHIPRVSWNGPARELRIKLLLLRSTEPEDLILARPHDPRTAADLGDLWELVPTVGGKLTRQVASVRRPRYQHALEYGSAPDADIFRPATMRTVIVSDRLRRILEPVADGALEFQAVIHGELPPPPPLEYYLLRDGDPVPEGYEVTETSVAPITGGTLRKATPIVAPKR